MSDTKEAEALAKKRRAAQHPDRPGERCDAPAGTWTPIVDHGRCEAKRLRGRLVPTTCSRLDGSPTATSAFCRHSQNFGFWRIAAEPRTRPTPMPAGPADCASSLAPRAPSRSYDVPPAADPSSTGA